MDAIPLALDGYLVSEAEPGVHEDTASWRLTCSVGTDHLVEEAVIPCTTMQPQIAHALLTERQPGDLLRVTGHLVLPDTADGCIRLDADSLEVLWEAPLLDLDDDAEAGAMTTSGTHTDRSTAIAVLAEALTGLGQITPGPGQSIRIHLSPAGPLGFGVEHCHSITLSPTLAHRLADYIDALNCQSDRPDTVLLDPDTVADLTDLFDAIDLTALTSTVLNASRPEHRPAVTRALDDVFGNAPGPDDLDP
ncbi:hypothetical protein [Streptomyces sp. NPDC049916]|uniref:hypothetical protein n=1 Tax=Streptomyces sp. NPDC049916 TaxID=3155156 RepID=UPI00342C4558